MYNAQSFRPRHDIELFSLWSIERHQLSALEETNLPFHGHWIGPRLSQLGICVLCGLHGHDGRLWLQLSLRRFVDGGRGSSHLFGFCWREFGRI